MKHEKDIETTISLGNGGSTVRVSFVRSYYSEPYEYGANADGRLGVGRTSIEDDRAEGIHVLIGEHWASLDELGPSLRIAIEDAVDNWLEHNEVRL